MVNVEALDRLINNIELEKITHNQNSWMKNGKNVFTIDESDRWACATSACAAGFTWLAEAPGDSVFDVDQETVFTSEEYEEYLRLSREISSLYYEDMYSDHAEDLEQKLDKLGVRIDKWAGEVLGISEEDAETVFYTFDGTEETLRQLRHLREFGSLSGYLRGPEHIDEEEPFSYEPDMVEPPF